MPKPGRGLAIQPAGGSSVVADAGPVQSRTNVNLVTLDGSGSSGYGTIAWTLTRLNPDGTTTDKTSLLSDPTVIGPTFTPEYAGYDYQATLTLDGTVSDSTTIKISNRLVLDMSAGVTESNTGQKGGNTSLGTSSDIEVAAVQGDPNNLNCYMAMVELPGRPPNATGVTLHMTCNNPDKTAAIGDNAGLYAALGTVAALTLNQQYVWGWEWQNTSTRYRTHENAARMGNNPAGVTVIDTQADVGILHAKGSVLLDPSTGLPVRCTGQAWGSGGVLNGSSDGAQAANLLSVGAALYGGFCCEQASATPGDVLFMQNTVFEVEWSVE